MRKTEMQLDLDEFASIPGVEEYSEANETAVKAKTRSAFATRLGQLAKERRLAKAEEARVVERRWAMATFAHAHADTVRASANFIEMRAGASRS